MEHRKKIAPEAKHTAGEAFERLLEILGTLRTDCPWDKKQTMLSLRPLSIEELYELTDAILDEDMQEVQKELGDVMMHLVFYARIAEEAGAFDIVDVLNGVCDKLIQRHPHIYGDIALNDAEAVKQNWEKIKLKEGNRSVLSGVPKSLPALVKAYRIQDKVRGVGFDWENSEQVWDKVQEELQEFRQEVEAGKSKAALEGEFGDLLFALINYGRFLDINPENALDRTNKKFIKRFTYIEEQARSTGHKIQDISLDTMNLYWEAAKKLEEPL